MNGGGIRMSPTHNKQYDGWVWKQFNPKEKLDMDLIGESNWQFDNWYQQCRNRVTDYIGVRTQGDDHALFGSLIYYHEPNDAQTKLFLHYYVKENVLLTSYIDLGLLKRTNEQDVYDRLDTCKSATDAFYILFGEIINSFLEGIDEFEIALRKLQDERKKGRNSGKMLENIIDLRDMLLHWNALTLPAQDTLLAAREAFMDELQASKTYQRTSLRLERLFILLKYYEKEMDTLLSIEDNLINYRGNEIVRALTVFTVVFIPMTALGAVWGMNFKHMPELETPWGYGISLLIMFFSMTMIYLFLRKKGWTEDLLKGKKYR
jgi:magnesium transporter